MAINIIDFIPYGQENAVPYSQLTLVTGWDKRKVRAELHKAKCKERICFTQDGKGFFRPIEGEEDGIAERFMKQEQHRINELIEALKPFRDYCYIKGLE